MSERTIDEQLTKHLTDAHSIEVQALEQMRFAPRIAGHPDLSRIFTEHLEETRRHEQIVATELGRRHASPSMIKDVAGRVGGWGMVLFAAVNPDTPGKLAFHAHSYEHMELATYELLRRIAERAGDTEVRDVAFAIGGEERAMADRIAERWDLAVEASLHDKGADDLRKEVAKYLRDAHALEGQAKQLLESGPEIAEQPALAELFRSHLEETKEHQRLVDERLSALGSAPSRFQSGALRLGALNLGGFFKLQPDTPAKLAGFAYAFEALEVGCYELLLRVARRAGDDETATMAERILREEQAAAAKVTETWDAAVDAALAQQGVTA